MRPRVTLTQRPTVNESTRTHSVAREFKMGLREELLGPLHTFITIFFNIPAINPAIFWGEH